MAIQTLGLSPPEKRNLLNNPNVPLSEPASWGWAVWDGVETDAQEPMDEHLAMKISTVFTCVRVLSESVASLPVRLLRVTPQGCIHEQEDPLAYLLGTAPNPEMTSFVYFDTVTHHLVLTGNSYSQIQRGADGSPVALYPLHPHQTRPIRRPTGELCYETTDGGTKRILEAVDVLHIPLTTFDGLVGLSPIRQAARCLGLAAATERSGSRFFGNYAMPKIALINKKVIKPEDKLKMRKDWESLQSGSNQHRVAILDQEMDLKTLSISPDESQFLQTRVHQRSEICSIFRVPVHMAGSEQKLSNSNVEQINLSFILDTLRPLLTRIESELVKKLIPGVPGQANTLAIQFDLSERQRGDTAAQVSLITAGRQWGVMTANDARRVLSLPAIDAPEENITMVPINMQSSKRLLNVTAPIEQVVTDAA